MKTSKRDRALLLLLPSLVVVAMYSAFFSVGSFKRLSKAREQLATASKNAVSENAVQVERATLKHLKDKHARLDEESRRLQAALDDLRTRLYRGGRRTAAADDLSNLLDSHRLVLVKSQPASSSNSVTLRRLEQRLNTDRGEKATARLFEVQLMGSYPDVASLLQAMLDDPSLGIPISLEMEEASIDTGVRRWTLQLWM